MLTQLIELAIERGDLETTDAEYAADALAGLWFGFVNLEIKLGVRAPLTADEIEERVSKRGAFFHDRLRQWGGTMAMLRCSSRLTSCVYPNKSRTPTACVRNHLIQL